jgi:F0F1-type ATP synthase assembly protein I
LRVNAGLTDNCLQGIIVMFCAPVGVVVGLLTLGRMGGLVFGLIGGLVAGLILGSAINSIRRAAHAKAARRGPNSPS